MDLQWQIKIIDGLIAEKSDYTIAEYLELIKELESIEMQKYHFTSPLVPMPFGVHRGKQLWTIGDNYFDWLLKQPITPETVKTIEYAKLLYHNQGSFAVIEKSIKNRFLIAVASVWENERMATANAPYNTDTHTYHVIRIRDTGASLIKFYEKGYFPEQDDFEYRPKY